MKVLHITKSDYDGAGLCSKRISNALNKQGIDSKLLVLEKRSSDNTVYLFSPTIFNKIHNYLIKFFRLIGLNIFRQLRFEKKMIKYSFWGTLPTSNINILNHPLVKQADIIHLHWINNFIDYNSFFGKINKPIVWTQHDENIYFGIFHYKTDFSQKNSELRHYEDKFREQKIKCISSNKNIQLISLSNEMFDETQKHEFTKKISYTIINNSVNYNEFIPFDKVFARKVFGLPLNKKLFLFVAADISDERKGLRKLVAAINQLNNSEYAIYTVGLNNKKADDISNIFRLGQINDVRLMSLAYSACDKFIMPSLQEAFSQAPLEAMSCGKPVIVFPVSGTKELMNDKLGVRCNGFEVSDLVNGILKAESMNFDSELIRNEMIERFSPSIIANKYIEVYKNMY